MNLENIFKMWDVDAVINDLDLASESTKIPRLHSKYFRVLSDERLLLKKYQSDLKRLSLAKYEFYTQGPDEESVKNGWELPPKGMILKSEIDRYLEADSDIININLKIALQNEKVEVLKSIIDSLMKRGFNIKSAIEFMRFQHGG